MRNYVCVCLAIMGCWIPVSEASNHRRLRDHLMQNYGDIHIRPVNETTTPTIVTIRPHFTNLVNMDTRNQHFTIETWLKTTWQDEFLTWDPSEYNGTSKILLPADSVWTPDITFLENVDNKFQQIKPDTVIEVHSDGYMRWFAPSIFVSGCPIRVTWYPYDIQVCDMTFGSFGYNGYEVEFRPEESKDSSQTRYLENGVWDMVAVNKKQITTTYSCCETPFYESRYRLIFKRQPDFYIIYLIVPVFLLSLLSILVFYLPPESGEKLTLSITNLLALVVFQQLISENIPPSGDESPIIGQYFLSMITMVSASVVATILVIHINGVSYRPLPRWVRWLLLQKLPRFLCLNTNAIRDNQTYKVHDTISKALQPRPLTPEINDDVFPEPRPTTPGIEAKSTVKTSKNDNQSDWKLVSVVVDRCFLIVFSVFGFVVTATLFTIIIVGSNNEFDHEMNILQNEWAQDTVRSL